MNARQFHVITAGDEDCELDCVIFQPMLLCSSKHIEKKFGYPIISNPSVPYVILHERRSVSKNKQYDGGLEIIRRMILYIQEHYKERINLNQLCREGGVSRTACTKLFLKYVNVTPIDYVRHYRIAKSIELLQSTDKTITEIAYETGFSGTSFYAKMFRKITGITPRQLRKGEKI